MRIACRCEKCNTTFTGDEEDTFMEYDFVEQQIRFYCRVKSCKHVNIMDFKSWKEKQKSSPLPPTRMV